MCRFCACELSKQELSKQCAYKKHNIEYNVPWSSNNNIVDYYPSNMMQPKDGLPVIIDGKHLQSSENRLFYPMYWSLVPSWFKDDEKEWKALTHNARIENLFGSKVYSSSLNEGKRCIVIMEGFFEFKKPGPQPAETYYLHSPQRDLLKAAGLFSSRKKENGEIVHSCTVITTESDNNVSQIHHRAPIFLNEDVDVEAWLDFKSISSADAVDKLKNVRQKDLKFYKVSKVGSKEPATEKKVLASKNVMSNWLNANTTKGMKRKAED